MTDRLAELKGGAVSDDLEAGGRPPANYGESSKFMNEFFKEVAGIKQSVSLIRRNMTEIERCHGQALTSINNEASKGLTEKLEKLMAETNHQATEVRNKLKVMDTENKEFAKREPGASETRIRANMHGTLTRKFVDLMTDYRELQTKYKNKYRERVERQYKIVKPDASDDEIRDVLQGDNNQEIFTQQILQQGPGQAAAKNALADIQERHRDITKLETSIAELHQLFLDMSVLVENQGELLDQIEYTVSQSVSYTGKAVDELRQANKYTKQFRKKMCWLIVCFLIVLMVIFGSVIGNAMQNL